MEQTLTQSEAEAAMEKEESLHDSSSDSNSNSDSELNLQIQSLEAKLAVNPSNYDSHFQYIKLLRRMGDVDNLTKAREAISQVFPLSPSMWQEWVKDELSLKPDFSVVLNLYERALFDYLSVSLWCDYINFVKEVDSIVSTSKIRVLFMTALAAAGLHISQGSQLWESYRLYEEVILLTIDESDTEAKDKQIQHIRTLFRRQLSVPLVDMTSTLTTYKIWEAGHGNYLHEVDINPHVASSYQKALDMYNARKHFEQQISSLEDIPDSQRLQHYMGHDLLQFVRESVVVYLDDEDRATRKDAALCCCKLVANSFSGIMSVHFGSSHLNRSGGGKRRRLVEQRSFSFLLLQMLMLLFATLSLLLFMVIEVLMSTWHKLTI